MSATSNGAALAVTELDLDAILGQIDISPKPVKLGGKTFMVRRDLNTADATQCLRLINESKELEATAMLVGSDAAVELDQMLRDLPRAHTEAASRHLLQIAGLVMPGGSQGESPAS